MLEDITHADRGDYVLRTVEERGVRFVRLWFVDVLGVLKSLALPVSELEQALAEGVGIDGSSLEAGARLRERDAIAHPDPETFQLLPWRPGSLVGRMLCDVRLPDGTPSPGDSRHALRRVLDQAAGLGYSFQVGPEIEFYLFEDLADAGEPKTLDDGAYFDQTTYDGTSDFRRRAIEYVEQMGIPVKASHHEVSASQHEIDLHHTDALSMADAVTTFRVCVKEVARELGVYATFMPKPSERLAGSGMHLHLSLFEGDDNAFHSHDPLEPLSQLGQSFLAGVLAHAAELTAVTNQWVNSYKRLALGFEAPQRVDWARQGTDSLVRVPSNRPDRASAARVELRSPDPGCNPYLAFALLLAAGLQGVERGYQLPAEHASDRGDGFAPLPQDLREAIDLFDESQLARDTLGDVLCEWIVRNKRAEWETYRKTVTELERRSLLRIL
ncbi:MAG TPA: glutamine synthetase family protein [Solirubrobacteraceae bacterium]|nr:glutamine synthetase family protein [Solirubrobacteraceae bacterium]